MANINCMFAGVIILIIGAIVIFFSPILGVFIFVLGLIVGCCSIFVNDRGELTNQKYPNSNINKTYNQLTKEEEEQLLNEPN